MSFTSAQTILECHFLQEKNEDGNGLLQEVFDFLDEFVEAFGKNADKNINVIFGKIGLLHFSGMHASEYQIALDLFDLALNIQSRFLGDDTNSYAFILLSKAMKIQEITNSKKSKQIAEWMYSCLEIFYEDEENNKKYIQDAHRYLAYFHKETSSIDDSTMHGRKVIKLEREIYGGIRRLGQFGI